MPDRITNAVTDGLIIPDRHTVEVGRLKRKLGQRDIRIAGLERRIKELERTLATQSVRAKWMPIDVERAVQNALCNVRMIPVIGTSSSKIMSITLTEKPKT